MVQGLRFGVQGVGGGARGKKSVDTTPCRMTGVILHSHVHYVCSGLEVDVIV